MYIYIYIYVYMWYIYIYIYIYISYTWSRVPCSYPPQWYGSPGSTPFPSICKLLAAFLRSSLVFARSLQHFWLPASHLLGTSYLLDDLCSTHTPSKYLRATYSHIYMCYVSTSYLLHIYIHIIDTYIYIYLFIYTQYHTLTTPQGGKGTVLWLTHDHGRGGRRLERWTRYIYIYHLFINIIKYLYQWTNEYIYIYIIFIYIYNIF